MNWTADQKISAYKKMHGKPPSDKQIAKLRAAEKKNSGHWYGKKIG